MLSNFFINLLLVSTLITSCNNQKSEQTTVSREDSLLQVIEQLKNNETKTNKQEQSVIQAQQSQKKFAFVLIDYVKAYEYYFEYGKLKEYKEREGNYKDGEWNNHLDTVTTMSSIKEYDFYNSDIEYQLLDEVEKSLPYITQKNVRNIDIIKINFRTAKVFNTYAEASKAQEDFKRKSENQRVQKLKDGGFKFNR